MIYETLKVCAGRMQFTPDQEIEIADRHLADLLLADGAIRPKTVAAEKPKATKKGKPSQEPEENQAAKE